MLKREFLIIGYFILSIINGKCTANSLKKDKVILIIDRNELLCKIRLLYFRVLPIGLLIYLWYFQPRLS